MEANISAQPKKLRVKGLKTSKMNAKRNGHSDAAPKATSRKGRPAKDYCIEDAVGTVRPFDERCH